MKGWHKGTARQTHRVQMDGGLSGVAYTEQQYITTYLLGVQEAAMRKHEI
jgi:hypothetical protein